VLVRSWVRRALADGFALIGAFTLVGFFVSITSRRWTAAVATIAVVTVAWWLAFRFNRSPRSQAAVTGHIVLFETPMHAPPGLTPPLTIRGPRDAIERFITRAEINELFDRWMIWAAPARPTIDMPGEALGVWGRRKCSRFRRLLRERGAVLEVRRAVGPEQRFASSGRGYGR